MDRAIALTDRARKAYNAGNAVKANELVQKAAAYFVVADHLHVKLCVPEYSEKGLDLGDIVRSLSESLGLMALTENSPVRKRLSDLDRAIQEFIDAKTFFRAGTDSYEGYTHDLALLHRERDRLATIAGGRPKGEPPLTASPQACTRPDSPTILERAVEPDMPAMAQQQGITGDVIVDVDVDETGRITSATVESSPSKILNAAALSAARQSTFSAPIRNCKPISGSFRFVVTFASTQN